MRVIHDYIALNSKTRKDEFPFPSLDDKLNGFSEAKIFLTVDIDAGFYQIRMKKEDMYKSVFSVPFGHFEYQRIPFGLCNVAKTFQRTIGNLLKDFDFSKVFVDDVLIFSNNYEDHMNHVDKVLTRLIKKEETFNISKSEFGKEEIKYLGLIINGQSIKGDLSRFKKFKDQQPPFTRKNYNNSWDLLTSSADIFLTLVN